MRPEPDATPDPAPPPSEDPPEATSEAASDPVTRGRLIAEDVQPGLAQFADAYAGDGTLWIGPLRGNGERDVVIYLPPDPDPAAKVHLVYHFHGTYSEHIEPKRPDLDKKKWVGWNRLEQTIEAADALQAKGPDAVVLVYPISAGKRKEPDYEGWFNGAYDRMWMRPDPPKFTDDFETLHRDTVNVLREQLGVAPKRLRKKVTAEGHSAGGVALRNIAMSGTKRVREYIFQDAAFQTWADGCYDGVQASGADSLITLVITTAGIGDPLAGRSPWCRELKADDTAYTAAKAKCTADAKAKVGGRDCEELAARAEEWTEFQTWCDNLENDMADVPNVYVHRTRIRHGDQPRHFTGGLELPASRLSGG